MIPDLLRQKLIQHAHESHFGMDITKFNLKKNVWWPGMDRDVEFFIRNCYECSYKPKSNFEKMTHTWKPAENPFERVHMDWAFINNVENVLILVDSYSGWPEVFVCRDRTSSTVKKNTAVNIREIWCAAIFSK